jgi:AMMECR1 domain-containing protein
MLKFQKAILQEDIWRGKIIPHFAIARSNSDEAFFLKKITKCIYKKYITLYNIFEISNFITEISRMKYAYRKKI